MANTKILLAGPGTGKTTKIKDIIKTHSDLSNILILSFTNASIADLLSAFKADNIAIDETGCMTLHKYALRINHLANCHILNYEEERILKYYSEKIGADFNTLCKLFNCITFQNMIVQCAQFLTNNEAYAKDKIGELELLVVDEYQDFNPEEQHFIKLVANYAKEVVFLGDDDQCIYGFKNADSNGIISIYNDTACEKVPHDNKCYRCPDKVVEACTNLIKQNKNRVDKNWLPTNKSGDIILEQKLDDVATSDFVINEINTIRQNNKQATVMILSSVGFATEHLAEQFKSKQLDFINWFSSQQTVNSEHLWTLRAIFGISKLLNLLFLAHQAKKENATKFKKFLESFKQDIQSSFDEAIILGKLLASGIFPTVLVDMIKQQPDFEQFFVDRPEYEIYKDHLADENKRQKSLEKLEGRPPPAAQESKQAKETINKRTIASNLFILSRGSLMRKLKMNPVSSLLLFRSRAIP